VSTTLVAVVAGVVTLVATPLVMAVAGRFGVVDRPGALKPQATAVPYLGGVAVFAGLLVGVLAGRPSVVVPLAMALALGVADDRSELAPVLRLAGQLAIGVAVAVTVPVHLEGAAGGVLVVVITVLVVNGVNLIDGLDLLATGVVLASSVGFAAVVHGGARDLALALAAALAAFAVYNRPPARVYLGDGGSYLLGTALTVLVASAWAPGIAVPTGVAALALLSVPAGEVAFAVVRRARGRRSLLAGDRGHPYDRLVDRGWPVPAASGAYIAVAAVVAAGTVLAVHLASMVAAVTLDVAAALLLVTGALATGALTPDRQARP
jgi:UDP-N-acetylmuramyl pentapeptide phosphotransferase/UDP-N-acetylglucosamine-1-phosphate transferase